MRVLSLLMRSFVALFLVACGATGGGSSKKDAQGSATAGGDTSGFTVNDVVGGGGGDGSDSQLTPDAGADTAEQPPPGKLCIANKAMCVTPDERKVCAEDGLSWKPLPCQPGEKCFEGQCGAPGACTPGEEKHECGTSTHFVACNPVGSGWTHVPCPDGKACYLGSCVNYKCLPGAKTCLGFGAVQKCRPDGSGSDVIEECEKGGSCKEGQCLSACAVDIKAQTYRGCEYYAVDLDNTEGGEHEPVALVVSVPSVLGNADVFITDTTTGNPLSASELQALTLTVPSGGLGVFLLPPDRDVDGSGVSTRSFHVQTSVPATVHQFNPLNGENVYTNDASLLLPTHSAGRRYFVMSWPMRSDASFTLRGYVTIVATEPGQTLVTVTPRSDVIGGPGVEPITKGQTVSFFLSQGQVLNLETDGAEGADLTGSYVEASAKIVVFGGHECANVPLGITACDHLEQQLLPVAAWGSQYVADGFKPRGAGDFDMWRVMAGRADVTIETNPPVPGYGKFKLQAGQFVTFPSSDHFELKATGPILVGHFMIGSSYPGFVATCDKSGIGDPSLTLAVPRQQYLTEYTVLAPPGYTANYLNVVAKAGTEVLVDGQAITVPFAQVGGSEYGVAQVPVSDGVHSVTSDSKFGLTSYGYDCDVSYAYPGGLKLSAINEDLE